MGRKRKANDAFVQGGAGANNADVIVSGRVNVETKVQYMSTIKFITNYCLKNISQAVSEGELILPIELNHLKILLGDMGADRIDGKVRSVSTVQGYISSLKYYYKEKSVKVSDEFREYCDLFIEGYKRKVALKKEQGLMKNFEGKVPVSHLLYIQLAELGLKACDNRSPFASLVHAFMVLCWNLFARSCSVADLRTHHFTWENDCMVIDMSRHKADQTGENITPKHVYANPYNPLICPILALALHVFSTSFRPENDDKNKIFVGVPYDIFTKWLGSSLAQLPLLGHSVKDFGTHSFRKGIASFCAGFIGGPSVIAIYLRAGWSLGQVQDRYITYSDGGDQLCGRVAAGLDFNAGANFAVLPPRLSSVSVLSGEEWNLIIPGYSDYPPGFQTCLPILTAQIVYHYRWILENVGKNHPIRTSRLFISGLIPKIREHVLDPITTGRCGVTSMAATGIPQHIELSRKLESMEKENVKLQERVECLQSAMMEQLPEKLLEAIRENYNIEGVQQMTRTEFRSLLSVEFDRYREEFTRSNYESTRTMLPAVTSSSENAQYLSWTWGGQLHRPVPETWSMPLGKVKTICDLFITGMPAEKIRPFHLIKCRYLARKDQSRFAKADGVFKFIVRVAKINQPTLDNISNLTLDIWDIIFRDSITVIVRMIQEANGKVLSKVGELSYVSMYDHIRALIPTLDQS